MSAQHEKVVIIFNDSKSIIIKITVMDNPSELHMETHNNWSHYYIELYNSITLLNIILLLYYIIFFMYCFSSHWCGGCSGLWVGFLSDNFDSKQYKDSVDLPSSCHPSQSLRAFAFIASEVRRLLLDLDTYGGADPSGMVPFSIIE